MPRAKRLTRKPIERTGHVEEEKQRHERYQVTKIERPVDYLNAAEPEDGRCGDIHEERLKGLVEGVLSIGLQVAFLNSFGDGAEFLGLGPAAAKRLHDPSAGEIFLEGLCRVPPCRAGSRAK